MKIKKHIELIKAPTPTKWKRIRNIAGTIAAVAGVLVFAPFSAPVIGTIATVGGIASILAGRKTLNHENVQDMSGETLIDLRTELISKTYSDSMSESDQESLDVIQKELKRRNLLS